MKEQNGRRKSQDGREPKSQRVPLDVDAYIAAAPAPARPLLHQLRGAIRSTAPEARERISYGMPTYEHHGRLAYFAGFKGHVGLYGVAHVDDDVADDVKPYLDNRSTLRFPVDRPLPIPLIRRLIKARVKENESGESAYGSRTASKQG